MIVDEKYLKDLLSSIQPGKSSLDMLRERREALLKKINQGISNPGDGSEPPANPENDRKQAIMELMDIDQQIQREIYEEKSKKLEIERLKYEEAAAKKFREREIILARHEAALCRRSDTKLLSAGSKANGLKIIVKSGVSLTLREAAAAGDGSCLSKLTDKLDEINRDLKESAEYRIAAAKVAARRRNNRIKKEIQEAALQKNKNKRKSQSKKSINFVV